MRRATLTTTALLASTLLGCDPPAASAPPTEPAPPTQGAERPAEPPPTAERIPGRPTAPPPAPLDVPPPAPVDVPPPAPVDASTPTAPARDAGVPQDPRALAPFTGAFQGERLALRLAPRDGALQGELEVRRRSHPVRAWVEDGRLVGRFSAGDQELPFAAETAGLDLTLDLDRKTYTLRRVDPVDPLALPDAPEPAGPEQDPGGGDLAGRWEGLLNAAPAAFEVEREGTAGLRGHLDARGYRYALEAELDADGVGHGLLVDEQTGARIPAELRAGPDDLVVVLSVRDAQSFTQRPVRLHLRRATPAPEADPGRSAPPAPR